jgi:hypothetical protein
MPLTSKTLMIPSRSFLNSLLEQNNLPSLEVTHADSAANDRMFVATDMADTLETADGELENG